MLKKLLFITILFSFLINSCQIAIVSSKPSYGFTMKEKDLEIFEIIGYIEVEFEVLQSNDEPTVRRKVIEELMNEGKSRYGDNIFIRNVKYTKHRSKKNILLPTTHFLIIKASGAVVKEKENN